MRKAWAFWRGLTMMQVKGPIPTLFCEESVDVAACEKRTRGICHCAMKQLFDMDDRARLPWRFFGATMTVLARG
jgi:hypothetical protein